MTRPGVATIVLAMAFAAAGCGSNSTTSPTTTSTSPTTLVWSPLLAPGGTASRLFSTTTAGTVTVTLTAAPVPLGFGVGVPRSSPVGCRLSVSTEDVAGATMSVPVEQGDYCVEVFDDGRLSAQAGFTVTVTYP
jgi:hypothetical protein